MERLFRKIWEQLRAKKRSYRNFLDTVQIKHLRGISDLSVSYEYPVSVLAGPNACGKSTVLYATACAYYDSDDSKDFRPATTFPLLNIRDKPEYPRDRFAERISLQYFYTKDGRPFRMEWNRNASGWSKNFMGMEGGRSLTRPQRPVYLRKLANLSNPSEVKSALTINTRVDSKEELTPELIAFAEQILPYQYGKISLLADSTKDVLYAERRSDADSETSAAYSEFHMSSGERAILRLSHKISTLHDGLILVDEVDTGLHPYTQQRLMLELQRLALRNNLQIIVTSHSPVIIDSVPPEGRIFLRRTADNVVIEPPMRDILQKALYGQSTDKLSILCEDDIAEAILTGIFDVLNPDIGLEHGDVVIGRDTGKSAFKNHLTPLAKFDRLDDFIFVLDGDAKKEAEEVTMRANEYGYSRFKPLLLPGQDIPESWLWQSLYNYSDEYGRQLGVRNLQDKLTEKDNLYDRSTENRKDIPKYKFASFAEEIKRDPVELARLIARYEANRPESPVKPFINELSEQIDAWRTPN